MSVFPCERSKRAVASPMPEFPPMSKWVSDMVKHGGQSKPVKGVNFGEDIHRGSLPDRQSRCIQVSSALGKCDNFFLFGFHHTAGLFKSDDECLRFVKHEFGGDGNHHWRAVHGYVEHAAIDG